MRKAGPDFWQPWGCPEGLGLGAVRLGARQPALLPRCA